MVSAAPPLQSPDARLALRWQGVRSLRSAESLLPLKVQGSAVPTSDPLAIPPQDNGPAARGWYETWAGRARKVLEHAATLLASPGPAGAAIALGKELASRIAAGSDSLMRSAPDAAARSLMQRLRDGANNLLRSYATGAGITVGLGLILLVLWLTKK